MKTSTPRLVRLIGLLATAGLLAGAALAQTKPVASPVNKKMTRDELRACMKLKDDAAALNTTVEAQRKELDAKKAEIAKENEALKAMKVEIDAKSAEVKTLQTAYAAHQAAINDWNQRMEQLVKDKPRNYDRLRFRLDDEQRELKKKQTELDAQRDALMGGYKTLTDDYNARAAANTAAANDWNVRNGAAAKDSDRIFDLRADYQAECANRPFNEADEIAIKKEKGK